VGSALRQAVGTYVEADCREEDEAGCGKCVKAGCRG